MILKEIFLSMFRIVYVIIFILYMMTFLLTETRFQRLQTRPLHMTRDNHEKCVSVLKLNALCSFITGMLHYTCTFIQVVLPTYDKSLKPF